MPTRAQLLHRIHRRYRTTTAAMAIASIHLDFTRIENPDRVLDEVALRDDSPNLPYWAELWDSAAAVGEYLAAHFTLEQTAHSLNVLDLGCGMGLAGTVAAALSHHVLFADLESPALLFARLNSLPFQERVRIRRLDWGRDHLTDRFNLILGSDILYEKAQWPALQSFWQEHLAEGGSLVLGEPGRATGDQFPHWLASYPWHLAEQSVKVRSRQKPIRIFRCRRT